MLWDQFKGFLVMLMPVLFFMGGIMAFIYAILFIKKKKIGYSVILFIVVVLSIIFLIMFKKQKGFSVALDLCGLPCTEKKKKKKNIESLTVKSSGDKDEEEEDEEEETIDDTEQQTAPLDTDNVSD